MSSNPQSGEGKAQLTGLPIEERAAAGSGAGFKAGKDGPAVRPYRQYSKGRAGPLGPPAGKSERNRGIRFRLATSEKGARWRHQTKRSIDRRVSGLKTNRRILRLV